MRGIAIILNKTFYYFLGLFIIRLPGDLLPVFASRRGLLQRLFYLRISETLQPVVESLARIVAGPIRLEPDMQVAEMV